MTYSLSWVEPKLPDRFAYWPKSGREESELLPSEEIASLWLWSWPQLLGWPLRVNWLFSPVVGNKTYPGDLWGLDSRGNLLIVETKTDRNRSRTNPFEDFVPYTKSPKVATLWATESLRKRWQPLWRGERVFLERYSNTLTPAARLNGRYPGVVPYSRHRNAVCRWPDLYRERIESAFFGGRYERAINRGLRLRRAAGDPPPVFVGLVATVRNGHPRLSNAGQNDLSDLRVRLGRHHVFFRAMRATRGSKKIRFHAWCPDERL